MKVLTAEDLGIAAWESVEVPVSTLELSSLCHHIGSPILTERQETFLRDRFCTKLEDPETGQWICSWREDGI